MLNTILSFVEDDLGSIILIVILVAIVALVVVYMVRKHKKGGSCGCNCGCCGKNGSCKTQEKFDKSKKEEMIEQINSTCEEEKDEISK